MTLALYPWEDAELATDELAAEDANEYAAQLVEYSEWLTEIQEAWLDDVLADIDFDGDSDAYVPFSDINDLDFEEHFDDQIGYYESRCPYLF
jgi:hypothetical protein